MSSSSGASREFVLCSNDDAGKFIKRDMEVVKQWTVKHGDLFVLGRMMMIVIVMVMVVMIVMARVC